LFTFVGALRGHLCDSTAYLLKDDCRLFSLDINLFVTLYSLTDKILPYVKIPKCILPQKHVAGNIGVQDTHGIS